MSGVGALPAKVVLLEIALEARHGSTVDQKRKEKHCAIVRVYVVHTSRTFLA